eukprot:COSAG02_NODE_86_length_39084_cov_17.815724_39_plen_575_part_00
MRSTATAAAAAAAAAAVRGERGRRRALKRGGPAVPLLLLLLLLACCGANRPGGDAGGGMQVSLEMYGVIVVTRHGDRSALHPVPSALTPGLSDTDRSRWISAPWGDLTTRGEEQHRRLGARCRCRYGTLVGDRYDARKVYARSTASDRTLRSGQAFLFGLFSEPVACANPSGPYPYPWSAATATAGGLRGTGGGDEVTEPISSTDAPSPSAWGGAAGRTAALHSVPKAQDALLRAFDLCPVYQQHLGELHDGHEWRVKEKLELEPGGTLASWRSIVEAAGLAHDVEQTWSLWCFVPLFDSINVLLNHNFAHALPTLLTANNGALLDRAAKLYHWCRARKYGPTPQLGRLSGGLLVAAIRHRLVALANGAENGGLHEEGEEVEEAGLAADGGSGGAPLTPFTLYSAHDSTLMALCAALGAPLDYNPPYASALAIELWRHGSKAKFLDSDKEQWYVAVTMNGEPLSVPRANCAELGSDAEPACLIGLQALLRHTEAIVPDEYDHTSWHAECRGAGPGGEGRVPGVTQIEDGVAANSSSGKLIVFAFAAAVLISLLRRLRVTRTVQNCATQRRLDRD